MPREAQAWYFGLFALLFVPGVVLALIKAGIESRGLADYVVNTGSYAAPLAITSAATALILIELWGLAKIVSLLVWRKLMVIAAYLRDRFGWGRERDPRPKPTSDGGVFNHDVNRPPERFDDTPPGRIKPQEPEDQHDD